MIVLILIFSVAVLVLVAALFVSPHTPDADQFDDKPATGNIVPPPHVASRDDIL